MPSHQVPGASLADTCTCDTGRDGSSTGTAGRGAADSEPGAMTDVRLADRSVPARAPCLGGSPRYCRCVASPARDAAQTSSQHGQPADGSRAEPAGSRETRRQEVCQILRWRGYVTCEFFASASTAGEIVATSDAFRWRKSAPPPDRGRPREAFDGLVAALRADGWHECGRGPVWYERCFERVVVVSVAEAGIPAPAVDRNDGVPPDERLHTAAAPLLPPVGSRAGERPLDGEARAATSDAEVGVAAGESAEPVSPIAGQGRPRRWRRLLSVSVACFAVLAAGGWGVAERSQSVDAAPSAPIHRTSLPATRRAPAAEATEAPPVGRLGLVGIGRGSWVEARTDSARGRLLFAGVLAGGKSLVLRAHRLWVRFGGAGNLIIKVNGVRDLLNGTVDALVTVRGLERP